MTSYLKVTGEGEIYHLCYVENKKESDTEKRD
jgi:hypothetical protein